VERRTIVEKKACRNGSNNWRKNKESDSWRKNNTRAWEEDLTLVGLGFW
jgi:hypothetical protein